MDENGNIAAYPAEAAHAAESTVNDARDNVRALVVKGLDESRARMAQARAAAQETAAALEASYGAAQSGVLALNVKAIEAAKAAADANFDFLAALAGAKTAAELLSLHTEFARKQVEDASARSTSLAELARKVADETVAPWREQASKVFKIAV